MQEQHLTYDIMKGSPGNHNLNHGHAEFSCNCLHAIGYEALMMHLLFD